MESKNTILNEIRDISPVLAELHGKQVYRVPEGYFADLTEHIRETVLTNEIKQQVLLESTEQTVPDGYFDQLSTRILSRVQNQEEESDVLSEIGNANVYLVPEGYFDQLPGIIINKIGTRKAKVVPFYRRKPVAYAVAAAAAVILFIGMVYTPFKSNSNNDTFAIVSHKTVADKGALKYNSQKAFDEGLASLSDDQIADYLNSHNTMMAHGQLKDAVNTADMPDQIDYLSDDGTLERYLNSVVNSKSSLLNP